MVVGGSQQEGLVEVDSQSILSVDILVLTEESSPKADTIRLGDSPSYHAWCRMVAVGGVAADAAAEMGRDIL